VSTCSTFAAGLTLADTDSWDSHVCEHDVENLCTAQLEVSGGWMIYVGEHANNTEGQVCKTRTCSHAMQLQLLQLVVMLTLSW
jgi:hypothetical protein